MNLRIKQIDGFTIATPNLRLKAKLGRFAAIVEQGKVVAIFRGETDAYDWACDTNCGRDIPRGYNVRPIQNSRAKLIRHTIDSGARP